MSSHYTSGAIHLLDPGRISSMRLPSSHPRGENVQTFDAALLRLIELCTSYITAVKPGWAREANIFADHGSDTDFHFIIWDYPKTQDGSWQTRTCVLAGGLVYDRQTGGWGVHT
jgi:hypothetical protein